MNKDLKELEDNFINHDFFNLIDKTFNDLAKRVKEKEKEFKIVKEDTTNKKIYVEFKSSISRTKHYNEYLKVKKMYPNYTIVEKEII